MPTKIVEIRHRAQERGSKARTSVTREQALEGRDGLISGPKGGRPKFNDVFHEVGKRDGRSPKKKKKSLKQRLAPLPGKKGEKEGWGSRKKHSFEKKSLMHVIEEGGEGQEKKASASGSHREKTSYFCKEGVRGLGKKMRGEESWFEKVWKTGFQAGSVEKKKSGTGKREHMGRRKESALLVGGSPFLLRREGTITSNSAE